MADAKISELPAVATPLDGDELVAIVQDGETKKATVEEVGGGLSTTFVKVADLSVKGRLLLGLTHLVSPGDPVAGGYFAGIIDTTRPGSIIAGDDYQVGLRYALIVAPGSLEGGRDTGTGDLRWHSSGGQSPAGTKTRWDGLSATNAMQAIGGAYEAATYAWNLAYPNDGGSRWYLPAMDELELIYRNLKPGAADNNTGNVAGGTFPGEAQAQGTNPSSDPTGVAYTTGSPAQTTKAAFKTGGAEALSVLHYYWTSTWYGASGARIQGGANITQGANSQNNTSTRVRPVRRVYL